MFKFDFSKDSSQSTPNANDHSKQAELNWLTAKEVFICDAIAITNNGDNCDTVHIGSEKLLCFKPRTITNLIKELSTSMDENLSLAEENHSDLITAKYEGGLKVWECTHDIARYLQPSLVEKKTVLDLGCGVGSLGILALKLKAKEVYFQDYNEDVLRLATIPNVLLNCDPDHTPNCRFFSGDWDSFGQLVNLSCDIVLTSETIYNPDNYLKLHNIICKTLKRTGVALVGAKTYYFGVGGSTRQFEKLVVEKGVFDVAVVWKCSEGVQREILKLTFKTEDS